MHCYVLHEQWPLGIHLCGQLHSERYCGICYVCSGALLRLEANAVIDLKTIRIGLRASRPRRTSVVASDARLQRLGRLLVNNNGNVRSAIINFLNQAVHLIDSIVEDVLR